MPIQLAYDWRVRLIFMLLTSIVCPYTRVGNLTLRPAPKLHDLGATTKTYPPDNARALPELHQYLPPAVDHPSVRTSKHRHHENLPL